MHNYEITVRPVSEKEIESGCEPFTRQVDDFVLGSATDGVETISATIALQGSDIVWVAVSELIVTLMKHSPEKFDDVLTAAMCSITSDRYREDEGHESLQDHC